MTARPFDPALRLGQFVVGVVGVFAVLLVALLARRGRAESPVLSQPGREAAAVFSEPGGTGQLGGRGRVVVEADGGVLTVQGTRWVHSLRCPDTSPREVRVEGTGLEIRVGGNCEQVWIAGDGNRLHLEDSSRLREVVVSGANHQLSGENPPQLFPSLRVVGSGHRFEGGLAALDLGPGKPES